MFDSNGSGRAKKNLIVFVLLLLFNIVFLISDSRAKEALKPSEIGLSFISVFQKGFTYTSSFFSGTINSINELKRVKSEYAKLIKKISVYESLEKNYLEIERENIELRRQLDFLKTGSVEKIPAMIIGNDPGNIFNTIVIDKGTDDGVFKNMPVVAFYDGFQGLVGRVIETGTKSSKVLPVYDKSFYVASRLQNLRYEGLVNGSGSSKNRIFMNYVNKSGRERITYGDIVITSGMKSIFPKGVYIGRVRSISAREYETSLQLEIEPTVDFSRLEYVFVLKQDEQSDE